MLYLSFDEDDIAGLGRESEIVTIYVEADASGRVLREVGVDRAGKVVHRSPDSQFRHGTYGLFDNTHVELGPGAIAIAEQEFERIWSS